jgi:heparanase 1
VTWHFYPTESDRTPIQLVPATEKTMLDPGTLDEASKWAKEVVGWRDLYQPASSVWLGETGPAQCGGQPGLSDTFASAFWWLDQLGSLARQGVALQVRQTLAGADYGMLADDFSPNPDFWGSLLWKSLMGEGVLQVDVTGGDGLVRAYAHETAARAGAPSGSATLLLLNLSTTKTETVQLANLTASTWTEYVVTAPTPTSKTISLNGVPLALTPSGSVPALQGRLASARSSIDLAPLSYELIVLPR